MSDLFDEQTYSPVDICDWFNISRTTLFRWEENGDISKAERGPRGQRIYRRQHVEQISKLVRKKIREDIDSQRKYNPDGAACSPLGMERLYQAEFFGGSDPMHGLHQLRGLALAGHLTTEATERLVEYALKQPQ